MKTIYIINYGTSQYYETKYGDKYYCSSLTSLKRKIKELLIEDNYEDKIIRDTLSPLLHYILDVKTMFDPGQTPNLIVKSWDLYIGITKENLY